jgi:hypothetical protein
MNAPHIMVAFGAVSSVSSCRTILRAGSPCENQFKLSNPPLCVCADIVAVNGDSLSDIKFMSQIAFVMKGGEVHKAVAQ